MAMKKSLIILLGPTAVGKTDISIKLARDLNCEIISADSMQVYRYMNIGTAKISKSEMQGIPHHLIDVVDPDEDFSVSIFKDMAGKCIDDILKRGKLPMVVGGTGLYINSLTHSMDFSEALEDPKYRRELIDLAHEKGNSYVHEMLKDVDHESYVRLHENDLKRVIRALEVFKHTGKTISEYQKKSRDKPIEYNPCMVGLIMERQKLYSRVNERVDRMIKKGLVEEVKSLLEMGYDKNLTSMQGLGYKEMISYLEGECSLEDAVYILKKNTRHFAKRQLTWFRREKSIKWVDVGEMDDRDNIVKNIEKYIAGKFNSI